MRKFRDRREEFEDEDDFDEEEGGGGRQKKLFRNKDFRDLNPRDKKARKEPKKPWGKKERILILAAVLATFGLSAFLYYYSSQDIEVPKFADIKLPNISVPNYFGEETIIIRK